MATHNLFQGGLRTNNRNYLAYPSRKPDIDFEWKADARHKSTFEVTRHLSFREPTRCLVGGKEKAQDSDIWNYRCAIESDGAPFAAADVINFIGVPADSVLLYGRWRVCNAGVGGVVSLGIENTTGNTINSVAAGTAVPIASAQSIATDVEGTAGFVDFAAENGGAPLYLTHWDMLTLTIDTLPTDGIDELDIEMTIVGMCFTGAD